MVGARRRRRRAADPGRRAAQAQCAARHADALGRSVDERREDDVPPAVVVVAHLLRALAGRLPVAVLEHDARPVTLGREGDLDLGRAGALGIDVPGEHEARGRLPRRHAAPVLALAFGELVHLAAFVLLEDDARHAVLVDRVRLRRPPAADLGREHLEGALRAAVDAERLADRRDRGYLGHRLLLSASAARLKASRASVQKSSNQVRTWPKPSGSTSYSRLVPTAWSRTRPASFRTRRCCETAGRLTGRPRASSTTGFGPERSRSKIDLRVGSPSASIG